MTVDMDYREQSITALGTETLLNAQGADTPGAFVVPTNVSRITEIRIYLASAATVDNIMGWSSGIHIFGSGVELSEGWFPGPCGMVAGAAATTPGTPHHPGQIYFTNIPVRPGGQFSINGILNGEDIGALHMLVQIIYDGPVVGRIRDMDYRSQDLTAANTLVTLNERIDAVDAGDFRPAYAEIGEIYIGMGAKITAGNAAIGLAAHLSGPGLQTAGNYKVLGKGASINDDVAISMTGGSLILEKYVLGIKTKIGNSIRVQAQMIEGDIGTAYAVVGFAYY